MSDECNELLVKILQFAFSDFQFIAVAFVCITIELKINSY
jgi:hypothetical protein